MKYNFDEIISRRRTCSYKWHTDAEEHDYRITVCIAA